MNLISTDPPTNNTNSTKIGWLLINSEMLDRADLYNRTLSYVVEIGNDSDELVFGGEISYVWDDEDITESSLGDTQLAVTSVKGDSNGDGNVTDFELLSYIDSWVQSQVSDFDLLEVIDNWSGS